MIDETALKSIEKLHEMKASGILSDAEFDAAKQKLLSGEKQQVGAPRSQPSSTVMPGDADHIGWMTLPLRRYAQFEGRSSRKEFWMFLLFANLVALAIFMLGLVIGFEASIVLMGLGVLGVIVPFIAVQVRRFHDQGKSGWFALINLVPYIGSLIVLAFMLIEGTRADNEFGPDPKG